MSEFNERLNALDISLFDKIQSQSTDDDRRSLLACESAVGNLQNGYMYLEIGSYLGGSIQPHLLDEKCARIYSIDKRPEVQPDARGYDWVYQNNSTARMIELLKGVSENTDKLTTIDGDTVTQQTVTIRDRDTLAQDRVPLSKVTEEIQRRLKG